jgi:hypothetical protein
MRHALSLFGGIQAGARSANSVIQEIAEDQAYRHRPGLSSSTSISARDNAILGVKCRLSSLDGLLGARYESTKGFALPDRDVLRPAAFSQIHWQPNTD